MTTLAAGPAIGDDWEAIRHELDTAFDASRSAMRDGRPIVYVVAGEDLLGRRGANRGSRPGAQP